MNRSQYAAVAAVAAVVLVGAAGALGAFGPSGPTDTGSPDTPADTPTDTPTDGPETTHLGSPGASLTVAADDGAVLRGESPLDPGTELAVRVTSSDSSAPFIRSTEATVQDDGTFEATVDLAVARQGTDVTVTVVHDGDELANRTATVVAPEDAATADTEPTKTAERDPVEATVDHDGDVLTVANASGQVVGGTTDLAPGTDVAVRVRSSNGRSPFVKQATTTVDDDGRFEVAFDFEDIPDGVEFQVSVRVDGERVTETPGEVVAAE